MPNRTNALNTFDFTGGLNTRKSSFQLAPNEVPEVLNMDFDPRGGVLTRKGWTRWSTNDVITVGSQPWLEMSGDDRVTVPDEAGFDLTGDCQIVVGFRLSDLTPAAQTTLAIHRTPAVLEGWSLQLLTNGKLYFDNVSVAGSGTLRSYTSSVSLDGVVTPNTNWWVGVSFDVDNGSGSSSARFWQSSTGPNGAWTELGVAQNVADTTARIAGQSALTIGAGVTGAAAMTGRLLHCELRNAIGASNTMSTVSVVFEMDTSTDVTSLSPTATSFTTASGDTATLVGTSMLVASNWNPRNAYLHENSSGTKFTLIANGTVLRASEGGADTWETITNSDLVGDPHLASFAPWGDNLYVAQGRTKQGLRTTGTGAGTLLTASGAGQWQNDYSAAAGTHMPMAEHVASVNGYMFTGNVRHDNTNFPNRLRWSHPSQPERWHEFDFLDINKGGSKITAIVPFTDHLVIFKTDSVWALNGHNADTWELAEVTNDIGCPHEQGVAVGTQALFFFGGEGVFQYTRGGISEISYPIRDAFEGMNKNAINNVWLGWQNRKVWVAIPYDPESTAVQTDAIGLYVFDPLVGAGAWTRYKSGDNHPISPFIDHTSSADAPPLAVCRLTPEVVELDAVEAATDAMHGSPTGFVSHVRTAWLDASMPTLRKSWRRPDYVFRNLDGLLKIQVDSFTDFNAERIVRSSVVEIDALGEAAVWGDGGDWGADLWSSSARGLEAQIIRGKTLGLARAIALRFAAPAGARWGLNALVSKFVPRRLV